MTAVFAGRRRADEFAALVDDRAATGTTPAQAELLALVASLRATPPAPARPEFVADLRERLMDAADTLLVPATAAGGARPGDRVGDRSRLTLPPTQQRRDRRLATAIGAVALVGATASAAVASQGALPGEALYPVKRGIENIHAGISVDGSDRGRLLLADAAGRLGEVSALSSADQPAESGTVADTLDTFTTQARDASQLLLADYAQRGDRSSIVRLRDFDATSLQQLSDLEPLVPDAARDELMNAAGVVFEIDAAAGRACPACGGTGIHEIPGAFATVASGIAAVVVPSSTLEPLAPARATTPRRARRSPGTGPAGATTPGGAGPLAGSGTTAGGGTVAGSGTTAPASGDPVGSLADPLTGAVTGGSTLPTSAPTKDAVGELLQPAGNALKDAVKDATGSGLTGGGSLDATVGGVTGTVTGGPSGGATDGLLP